MKIRWGLEGSFCLLGIFTACGPITKNSNPSLQAPSSPEIRPQDSVFGKPLEASRIFGKGTNLEELFKISEEEMQPTQEIQFQHPQEKDYQVSVSKKEVKPEKIEWVRKNFKRLAPRSVTASESHGYELYSLKGYPDFDQTVYLHPKLFIYTGGGHGQVLGYRTGKKDSQGHELIEVSIPVALVNGLVSGLSMMSSALEEKDALVSLPERYRIPDVKALEAKLGKKLETLPSCPTTFLLRYQNREYTAHSPFEGMHFCPVNSFFRIRFTGPLHEVQTLLEAASRGSGVKLITFFKTSFHFFKSHSEIKISPKAYSIELNQALSAYESQGPEDQPKGYALADIEDAVMDALFQVTQTEKFSELNLEPAPNQSILQEVKTIVSRYFGPPYECGAGSQCRSLLQRHRQKGKLSFSWEESEELTSELRSQTESTLSAVAYSSPFIAKPWVSHFDQLRKPVGLKGKSSDQIPLECQIFLETHPVSSSEEDLEMKNYCQLWVENENKDPQKNLSLQKEGYVPLGVNVRVFPGAWIKLDIDQLEELTTAKMAPGPDGETILAPEVKDLLENRDRIQCSEGVGTGCLEYEMREEARYDSQGKWIGTHSVRSYECDPSDWTDYHCPYWIEEPFKVGEKVEHDCKTITQKRGGFLGIGSREESRIECHQKSKEDLIEKRLRSNCQKRSADDRGGHDLGIAPQVRFCKHPKYFCNRWNTACSKYTLDESFLVIHEDLWPHWRPFALKKGEFPESFHEGVSLAFVSGDQVVKDCPLNRFEIDPVKSVGTSLYFRIPFYDEEQKMKDLGCQGQALIWNEKTKKPFYYPQIFIKNVIPNRQWRPCGKTQYQFLTQDIALAATQKSLLPPVIQNKTHGEVGPVPGSCLAENPQRKTGSPDLWFLEDSPIRFSGRISVLGRVLEGVLQEEEKSK